MTTISTNNIAYTLGNQTFHFKMYQTFNSCKYVLV